MQYVVGQELYLKRRYAEGGLFVTVEKVGRKYAHCTFGWSVEVATHRLTGNGDQAYEVFESLAAYKEARRVAIATRKLLSKLEATLSGVRSRDAALETLKAFSARDLWEILYLMEKDYD